ncbi:hypothetical protein [Pontibacter chinhatensis]|uniref:Uncharacterized protein n=1 Tax=Pontibacter chinhatensis TaxID=1436961 RepID=A0A1I2Z217_9BACT|nr:hypothetical protein [Pontibacter chinhatensis]SFH31932.1 hypothetical protein SAMN05421739_11132 [Pontibacter chinhatensis]
MKKFKENQLKSLDKVVGGSEVVITISGVLDGVKKNTDFKIEKPSELEQA